MPKLGEVAGADIKVYYLDHDPPHVHAVHADGVIKIEIATGNIVRVRGTRPKARTERLILAWVQRHAVSLTAAFREIQAGIELKKMGPSDD